MHKNIFKAQPFLPPTVEPNYWQNFRLTPSRAVPVTFSLPFPRHSLFDFPEIITRRFYWFWVLQSLMTFQFISIPSPIVFKLHQID